MKNSIKPTLDLMQAVREQSRMLTVQQVAKLLGISSRSVYRLSDAGRMPRPLRLGGSVRWDRTVIESWIASNCPQDKGGKRS
jgi:prophage regulatory protein